MPSLFFIMDIQRLRMMLMKCKSSVVLMPFLTLKKIQALLSCLLQMSIAVIVMLNFRANDRIQNFVFNLIGSYKPGKQQEVLQKYSDLSLLLHGLKIRDADNSL